MLVAGKKIDKKGERGEGREKERVGGRVALGTRKGLGDEAGLHDSVLGWGVPRKPITSCMRWRSSSNRREVSLNEGRDGSIKQLLEA